MRTPTLLLFSGMLCISAFAQGPTNGQRMRQLPLGHELRTTFDRLPAQAKSKAENWLNGLDRIPQIDFNNIKLDNEGGVFYVDPIADPSIAQDQTPKSNVNLKVSASDIFTLHSKPGASKVVHLDSIPVQSQESVE